MAKKKASRPAQPASPSQKKKGNGNGGKQAAPAHPAGLRAFVPPADSQQQAQPIPSQASGVAGGTEDARVARLESVVGSLSSQMGQLIEAVKTASHQPRYQETVTPPVQAGPQPIQHQPVPIQPAGITQQSGPVPVAMEAGDDQQEVAQAPAVHPRAEGGRQARFDTCAACGQRIKLGTVALSTNEYVPSGMTTKWLRLQQNILVRLGEDNFTKTYQVSGNWLADTLAKRQYGERATSVPGFLCGENTSQHPTVKLVQPLMRRATDDEERAQYAGRVMNEARRLQEAGLA